jgi:hypothetical protein
MPNQNTSMLNEYENNTAPTKPPEKLQLHEKSRSTQQQVQTFDKREPARDEFKENMAAA